MLKVLTRMAAGAALMAAASAAALADDIDPALVKSQTGPWLIARQDGKPGCRIDLLADQAIGGYALDHAEACGALFPSLADIAAWNFDGAGGIILIDPLRAVKARFVSNEGTALTQTADDSDHLLMVPAIDGIDHLPGKDQAAGPWQMQRPDGETLCAVTLVEQPNEDGEYPVRFDRDCPAAVKRLNLSTWLVEGADLTLYGADGTTLSFHPVAHGFEKNRSEGGKPLLLVRP